MKACVEMLGKAEARLESLPGMCREIGRSQDVAQHEVSLSGHGAPLRSRLYDYFCTIRNRTCELKCRCGIKWETAMLKLGWKAGTEQYAPEELLDYAIAAEDAGFDSIDASDHFHPWAEQG